MRPALCRFAPFLVAAALAACTVPTTERSMIDRGRYLVKISGCNDCHTEGFMESGGTTPEHEWLKGSRRGWHNESGTTYATNLRLLISQLSEQQWVQKARTMRTKAPMAWYRLMEITDDDLIAIHRYIASLGAAGSPAPAALPPGVTPPEPYIHFPNAH